MQEMRFDPWVGKILWRRQWQPTPVFLPGKSHGQRRLVGYSPWDHNILYIYNSAIRKRKILPFVTTWMKLEYHGKWNNSDRERQALNDLRCICPLPSPRVCSSSHPLSQWCYLTISSSAVPFSFCLQSFPASGLFQRVGSLHQVAKVLTILYYVFESCRWEVEWN